jgi:hypothetical protein
MNSIWIFWDPIQIQSIDNPIFLLLHRCTEVASCTRSVLSHDVIQKSSFVILLTQNNGGNFFFFVNDGAKNSFEMKQSGFFYLFVFWAFQSSSALIVFLFYHVVIMYRYSLEKKKRESSGTSSEANMIYWVKPLNLKPSTPVQHLVFSFYVSISLIFEIFDFILSDWVLFLTYPNLFEIKDFVGVVVFYAGRRRHLWSKSIYNLPLCKYI